MYGGCIADSTQGDGDGMGGRRRRRGEALEKQGSFGPSSLCHNSYLLKFLLIETRLVVQTLTIQVGNLASGHDHQHENLSIMHGAECFSETA
jgi:hypothetical protein